MIFQPPPPAVSAPVIVTARKPKEAHVTMFCTVTVAGRLADCRILNETPRSSGIGAAALRIADHFRVTPAMRNGRPVESQITIPIKWIVADDAPAPPAAAGAPGPPPATAPPPGPPSSPP